MKVYRVRQGSHPSKLFALSEHAELINELLLSRGIETKESADAFLSPDFGAHVHDPFLLKDMDKTVSRLHEAFQKNEKVVIYSDYDADGGPGGVLLYDFFNKVGFKNFENYIPDRAVEGFGLNAEAVESFSKQNVDLVITVDCGIADVLEVELAMKNGIDVIITDHHEPGKESPPAFAILNPKQEGCAYPEKMLCGSGVAFKLVQGFLNKYRDEYLVKEGWEKWLLDLVGIATLSDMVPLVGENRVFAYYGLMVLRKSPRPGLMNLLRKLRINQRELTEDDVGFMISPRLNAASRMGDARDAFKLLSTQDETEADMISDHLNRINDERKGVVASMVKEIKHLVKDRYESKEKKLIVLGNPKWRPSLVGLAANTLMQEFLCPVFIWGREESSVIKGSCRSGGYVNLVELMQAVPPGILSNFGGHKMSGGFTVVPDKVHFLEEELNKAYKNTFVGRTDSEAEEVIFADKKLRLDELGWDLYDSLKKLSPFGVGNPKPVFLFEDVRVIQSRSFGKEKNHLELVLAKNEFDEKVSAIGFFMGTDQSKTSIKSGAKINLVANLERSTFKRYPELRLRIIDIF